jgi:hypothetical protein
MRAGKVIEYKVPDMFGRPWAEICQDDHERGMKRPEDKDIFNFERR